MSWLQDSKIYSLVPPEKARGSKGPTNVARARTSPRGYVNVGLVEWMAARKESPEPKGLRRSLAELLSVKSEEEDQVPGGWLSAQHAGSLVETRVLCEVDEDPRQMMLGCRKGVQWFGSGRKFPLFQELSGCLGLARRLKSHRFRRFLESPAHLHGDGLSGQHHGGLFAAPARLEPRSEAVWMVQVALPLRLPPKPAGGDRPGL